MRADRRVQRIVARYGECLGTLTTRQRRVLRLRAGVGPRDPATRSEVARRLELPLAKVRRAERRGLRTLRRAAREGCGAAASDGAGADPALASAPGAGGEDPTAAAAVLASGSAAGGDDRSQAGGEEPGGKAGGGAPDGSGADGGAAGGVKGITANGVPLNPGETGFVLPALGILLLLVCVAGFGLETRRVWRSHTGAGS